jgi:ArsR family transcriptional regulator
MNIEILANLFKALSEPVRLRILALLLEKGELCVCDLVDTLILSQSVISRHLAYLRNNDIVTARREGVWMYYQLTDYAHRELKPLLGFILVSLAQSKVIQEDLLNMSNPKSC